jgi:phospholipase/lecithinase/hemolysin
MPFKYCLQTIFRVLDMKPFIRLAAVCLTTLLAACGGGTSQVEVFIPDRILVFGDEHSSLTADGRKYSVNAVKTDNSIDCEGNPLWIQTVATVYGYAFKECPGTNTQSRAVTYAVPGATVADVIQQIDAQAALGFASKDLVLIMAGLNDVLQIYAARTPADTEEALLAAAQARGVALAQQVNRMVGLGAKVIVATMPDVGITPWAIAKGAAEAGLLKRLSAAFNGRLRVNILNDGRFVGLVLLDEALQSAVQVPGAFGLLNVKDAACRDTVLLPDCNAVTASLVDGASASTWLWADLLHFGPTGQRQLGVIASTRAQTNPF